MHNRAKHHNEDNKKEKQQDAAETSLPKNVMGVIKDGRKNGFHRDTMDLQR